MDSPVTRLPLIRLFPDDAWCDDPDYPPTTARWSGPIRPAPRPCGCDDHLYDVIVVLGHNDAPVVPGAGSAIFLHVAAPDYAPTEGCVAVALPDLLAPAARGAQGRGDRDPMITVWGRQDLAERVQGHVAAGRAGAAMRRIDGRRPVRRPEHARIRRAEPQPHRAVLQDGDLVLWESHAILRYLAARYGAGTFWPADPGAPRLADRWTDWTATNLQPPSWTCSGAMSARRPSSATGFHRQAAGAHGPAVRADGRGAVPPTWLSGERITMGDIPAACTLYRWYSLDLDKPRFPHVEAWYERLQQRPCLSRARHGLVRRAARPNEVLGFSIIAFARSAATRQSSLTGDYSFADRARRWPSRCGRGWRPSGRRFRSRRSCPC